MSSSSEEALQNAAVAVRENRLPEAISDLQNILTQSPDNFAANHLMGVALLKSKRVPEAIARLLKATQLKPDHVAARTHLGMAYAAADKPEMARKSYEAALKIDPAFAMAQSGLGKLPAPSAKKMAPTATDAPIPAPPPAKTPTAPKIKDFTAPGAIQAKPAPKENFLSNVDWAEVTLLGLGALFCLLGVWLRFGTYVDGVRPYRGFGIISLIIGISMMKAGWPGREHWRDDF